MLKVLLERRSIRKYKDKKIEEEKLKQVLAAGKVAPSGKNKKPLSYHFYCMTKLFYHYKNLK